MNAINVIMPYKMGPRMWAFDDESKGLQREPFIGQTNAIIDQMVKHLNNPEKGFMLLFSGTKFVDAEIKFEWVRHDDEFDGNWYKESSTGVQGWLCPALLKYFDTAPKEIWIAVSNLMMD